MGSSLVVTPIHHLTLAEDPDPCLGKINSTPALSEKFMTLSFSPTKQIGEDNLSQVAKNKGELLS